MPKSVLDDGFQDALTEGVELVGEPGIPMLMNLDNAQIPHGLVPFTKARRCANKRQYVHFYEHDREFSRVLTATNRYLPLLQMYDGAITPDCSMLIGQAPCLQQANTYMNRLLGFYWQRHGIAVIPNIRWSDESSFKYCFLGVPPDGIVCVSTHGCIHGSAKRIMFAKGLAAMLDALHPKTVLVHGLMPEDVFGEFEGQVEFHRYASQFERTHPKAGGC